MLWATGHYALAASLFPHTLGTAVDPERTHRIFLTVFVVVMLLDVAEGMIRQDLFRTPLYLPFMAHWTLLLLYRLLTRPRRSVSRGIAWYMFLSILFWSLFARRLLAA
jgi:hypothetical protein